MIPDGSPRMFVVLKAGMELRISFVKIVWFFISDCLIFWISIESIGSFFFLPITLLADVSMRYESRIEYEQDNRESRVNRCVNFSTVVNVIWE